jgi:hypothetical protein
MAIDWEHIYLLGWYDWSGRAYLTSWDGDHPVYDFVITGPSSPPKDIPMWDAPVDRETYKLYRIPPGEEPGSYAKRLGGYHVIGWYFEEGIPARLVQGVIES